MKKIKLSLILVSALFLGACSSHQNLVFKGNLPCADCEGINSTIILDLNSKNFKKTDVYKTSKPGKNSFDEKGSFQLDNEIYVLVNENGEKSYYKKLDENLIMLNSDKEEPMGVLREFYIYKKQ